LLVLFEPLHRRVAEAWREGRVIERDPTRGCGAPTVPDPLAQVLYPPALVRAALPFDAGFALWFALHSALAGAGAGHLARRLGAAALGALAVGMAALAGGAPVLVLLAPGVGVVLLALAWGRWRTLPGAALRVGGATALGALLAAAHLVPFLWFLPETPRAEG